MATTTKMIQLTIADRPTIRFVSHQYGLVRWHEYLALEAERINRNPERIAEVRKDRDSNKLSLWVDDIAKREPRDDQF